MGRGESGSSRSEEEEEDDDDDEQQIRRQRRSVLVLVFKWPACNKQWWQQFLRLATKRKAIEFAADTLLFSFSVSSQLYFAHHAQTSRETQRWCLVPFPPLLLRFYFSFKSSFRRYSMYIDSEKHCLLLFMYINDACKCIYQIFKRRLLLSAVFSRCLFLRRECFFFRQTNTLSDYDERFALWRLHTSHSMNRNQRHAWIIHQRTCSSWLIFWLGEIHERQDASSLAVLSERISGLYLSLWILSTRSSQASGAIGFPQESGWSSTTSFTRSTTEVRWMFNELVVDFCSLEHWIKLARNSTRVSISIVFELSSASISRLATNGKVTKPSTDNRCIEHKPIEFSILISEWESVFRFFQKRIRLLFSLGDQGDRSSSREDVSVESDLFLFWLRWRMYERLRFLSHCWLGGRIQQLSTNSRCVCLSARHIVDILWLFSYLEQTKNIVLSGPTSFVPMIRKLISYGIHCEHDFTMLIILTDEPKFSHQDPAIVESILTLACFPNACLLIIGLGDGPWHRMSYEEHRLRELVLSKTAKSKPLVQSKFIYDNFHLVDSSSMTLQTDKNLTDHQLARAVLTKLPTQLQQAFKHDQNNAHF